MKLSEFKESIIQRFVLLKANLIFTTQTDLAYAGNNWLNLFVTFAYTIATLIFINVIYANVNLFAGYSKNEMLFYYLISEITFFLNWTFTMNGLTNLIPDVNKGNLDMTLIKPVPSYFFLLTRSISIVSLLTNAAAPILTVILSINWHLISIPIVNLIVGILVMILGLVSMDAFQMLCAIPSFWLGESENILDTSAVISGTGGVLIPFEGFSINLQRLFGTFIPILIADAFATSILLGKVKPIPFLYWSLLVAVVSIIIKNVAWKLALKHYTSASS